MVEGRERSEWERTGFWCAMYANAHRDPKHRPNPFKASDFNPFTIGEDGAIAEIREAIRAKQAKGK